MSNEVIHDERPVTSRLHPRVYQVAAGLALWFVLSAWSFAGGGYSDWVLVVVSGLFLIAVGIPFILWRTRRRHPDVGAPKPPGRPFYDWAVGEFEALPGRLHGSTAAVEILLPLAAVAFSMTAFGIVLHFVAQAGGYH